MKSLVVSLVVLLGLCLCSPSFAEFEIEPAPTALLGIRFGQNDINQNAVGFFGAKLDWLLWGDGAQLSFLGPSLNFQTDGTFAPAISPVTVIMRTHFTFGMEIFPINSNQKGGIFGLSLGYRFE